MKPQDCFRFMIALLIAIHTFSESRAQGPVRAMYFPGTGVLTPTPVATTNSFVDLGTELKDSLATSNFTIELWVKMGATNSVNPVIIGDKDWASGANTGFVLSYYASTDASSGTAGANTLRFNFKPANGTRVDYDIPFSASIARSWNHIAITVNRSGSIIAYLNGVQAGRAYVTGGENISVDAGKTLAGTMPVRLGTDGKPFGYRAPFNGTMDEVRIWKSVRTAQELRDNMCHKLTGAESNLVAYYRMDETSGNTVINNATATAGQFNGTIVNGTYRVLSGAPVGDVSVNSYPASWTGQSLQLATTNRGVFTVDSFKTTGAYLHLYQINAVPDSIGGLSAFADNNVSFGTFASGDTFHYYPKYSYNNYANALVFRNTISFFSRRFNDEGRWNIKNNLFNNATAGIIRMDSVQGSRQFFLANFVNNCNVPGALGASNVQANSALLNWTSGGSALWNIQYGVSGFTLGTGTRRNAVNTNPYTLSGLQGNTTYQFYVQDSCSGIGSSSWAGPYSFTTSPDYSSFASGYALHLNGSGVQNSTVQAVNMGGALRDSLATSDFTIEMWVKMGATNTGNPPLIADKDYVSGANTGICWTYTASVLWGDAPARVFRFNFKPAGGARRDYDMRVPNEFVWNHLAITVDRRGFIRGYVNGVYMASTYASGAGSVAADSGKTLAAVMPLFLGTDGTGNYRVPLNGDMDEVRIWNKVRTETEIRAAMCHKLMGTEQGLLTYYRMDEPSGSRIMNSAATTGTVMDGTTINAPAHMISSAPLGDTSVYLYPASGWSGASLNMIAAGKGMLTVDSVTATGVPGVHIYTVNGVPNFRTGIANIGTTDKYFGVFTANSVNAKYRVQYDYNNYPNAVSNSANLHLYNRPDNASGQWAQLPSVHNATTHVIADKNLLGVRQYLLADFSAAACPPPSGITLNNTDTSAASFSWTSAAANHNTKVGPAGFNFGDSVANKVAVNNVRINNLTSSTSYDFYVQDSCGAGNTSAWVGPYHFETMNPCPKAENVFADSITTRSITLKWTDHGMVTTGYVIAWGISGTFTDPTIAIHQNAATTRHQFTMLQPNTSYDFYIMSNCAATIATSGWEGPFVYKTDSMTTSVPTLSGAQAAARIYPNPATERVVVELIDNNRDGVNAIAVYNNLGKRVHAQLIGQENKLEINTAALPDGIYYIELRSTKGLTHQAIVVQHP